MSSPTIPAAGSDAGTPSLSPRHRAWILFALSLGGFAIGTCEFASMGLMPNMVRALGVSEPQIGHLISAYALGVVVGAPLLAVLSNGWPRKKLLLALMVFYGLANLATALGPNYASLLVVRFISGLPHGAFFGLAAMTATAISPPHQRGRAVSLVMLGLTVAMLVGNPLATWLGQLASWRWAFALVTVIAMATVGLLAYFLPAQAVPQGNASVRAELRAFNRLPVWQALLIGAVGFAGMFCVISYLAPTLIEVTGVSERWVPLGLAAIGLGGFIGNFVGGWLFDRFQFRGVAIALAWAVLMLLIFPSAAHSPWTVLPAAVCVGIMSAMGPVLQIRLMDVAGEAQTLAAASHHAAFNAANALGPWLGGLAITAGWGWTSTGYVGAATAAAGLLLYFWAARTPVQVQALGEPV